jgi:hypothetical protein
MASVFTILPREIWQLIARPHKDSFVSRLLALTSLELWLVLKPSKVPPYNWGLAFGQWYDLETQLCLRAAAGDNRWELTFDGKTGRVIPEVLATGALYGNNIKNLDFLVTLGCPLNLTREEHFAVAVQWQDRLSVDWLIAVCGLAVDKAAFLDALDTGDLLFAKWLLCRSRKPDEIVAPEVNLARAIARKNIPMIRWLRSRGCQWSSGTFNIATAYLTVAELNDEFVVRGCPLPAAGTPVYPAVFTKGSVAVLEYLLTKHGLTIGSLAGAFAEAVYHHNWPMATWLFARDPRVGGYASATPPILDLDDLERLWAMGVRLPTPLFFFRANNTVGEATWLLDHGVMPTEKTLLAFINAGNLGVLKLLRERCGATLAWPSNAVAVTVEKKHLDLLKALLDWSVPL